MRGQFEWMRREVVAVVGGNYYHETPHMSMCMLTTSNEGRAQLLANDWDTTGDPLDVESPPNGSFLRVRYRNGDDVQINLRQWDSAPSLVAKHPRLLRLEDDIFFPLVTIEIAMVVGSTDVRFDCDQP